MSERMKLLEELMRAKEEDVPAYVRNFVVLYGHQGLARHVAEVVFYGERTLRSGQEAIANAHSLIEHAELA